jgi:hypothetical protein
LQLIVGNTYALDGTNTFQWISSAPRYGLELKSQDPAAVLHGDYYADFLVYLDG